MVGLGDLAGGESRSLAYAVSADGSVIVGTSGSEAAGEGNEAFRWTAGGGMVGLGMLGVWSTANGVSADGSVVVGQSYHSGGYNEAFRWTAGGGMVGLGDLPEGEFESKAYGTSADGSVVVGYGYVFKTGQQAFIWDSVNGMRSLKTVLQNDFQLDLSGWTLTVAKDISDNGLVIVGNGVNPSGDNEAWMAVFIESPEADAGSDQLVIDIGDNGWEDVTLDGSGSYDVDGTIVSWEWVDDLGDTIPDGENPTASLSLGLHTITLTVTDDDALIGIDTVTIHVVPTIQILTVAVEPNDVGIDTIDPNIGDSNHYTGATVNLSAAMFVDCPDVYSFDYWIGDVNDVNDPNTTVFMDSDKTVTAYFVATRECGDECHPNDLFGDYDHDCIIDSNDFAWFADNWLACTKPECD